MKHKRSRARDGRQAYDGDQLVLLVIVIGLAWSCWNFMKPPPAVPHAVAAGDATAVEILQPALRPGWIHQLDDPAIGDWWKLGSFEHQIHGQVTNPGSDLQVRPWLYTDAWLPQPVVAVAPDGTFDATLYFSPAYDGPVVLAVEIEDRERKQVVSRTNYHFRAGQGVRQ